ncbi:MAG: hypothetical protein GWP47_04920 [Actinobacteria bacterium]|jgi:hypothetical protein|nr:hypothetical protein [Actinomycetota bacterium]NCG38301.1 hypothetical protein [Actinomycetota bacterium]
MDRPSRYEGNRYLGDKRVQVVYDVDEITDDDMILRVTELASTSFGQTFGPDTLAEARNRGYDPV